MEKHSRSKMLELYINSRLHFMICVCVFVCVVSVVQQCEKQPAKFNLENMRHIENMVHTESHFGHIYTIIHLMLAQNT